MKTCPVCGLDVEDSYLFCPDDGAKLIGEQIADTSFTPAPDTHFKPAETRALNESVVLHCGECAAEYPMTFFECPVHHVPLTRDKIESVAAVPATEAVPAIVAETPEPEINPADEREQDYRGALVSSSMLAGPVTDFSNEKQGHEAAAGQFSSVSYSRLAGFATARRSKSGPPSILAFEDPADEPEAGRLSASSAPAYETSSFKIVAAAMVIGLVIFFVIAVYTFFSAGGRRQTLARAAQAEAAAAAVTEPPSFVPTPESALEYQAEASPKPASDDVANKQSQQPPSAAQPVSTSARADQIKQQLTASSPAPVLANRTPNASPSPVVTRTPASREVALPRIDPGSIDARLIRVRSMRIASGVRYDLTFDLQDESGRHAQWERMLISTRSASGISHTQAVPFVHRLGARGALTFTLSVEMRGKSEPDWQGRVVCTTTGADNDGRPVRASFGASVSP